MRVVFLLHLWWIPFPKLMLLVPLSDCISCCLVALNTVWYCWRPSFSWWSNLALLVSSCSCCCTSGHKLLFLHWLLTSSLAALQFWKFSIFCFWEVSEGAAANCSFTILNWFLFRTIKNPFELIFSLMRLAFSEVVLTWKFLQKKFVSSRFLVTLFNKLIKLSIIFCLLSYSFRKEPISSCRKLSKQYAEFKWAFLTFLWWLRCCGVFL